MPVKYIPYQPEPLRGQAVLPFLRYHRQILSKDFLLQGMPYFDVELVEQVNTKSDKKNDNLLIHGDCLNACAYLKEKGIKVDLVYIDPPFASGANYAKKIYIRKNPKLLAKLEEAETKLKQQHAEEGLEVDNRDLQAIEEVMYGDIWQKEDYLNWMYERLLAIKEIMSDTGSLYFHIDYHIGHYIKVLLDEVFGEENLINDVIWHYSTSSGAGQQKFIKNHDYIFFYAKDKENYHFNLIKEPWPEKTLKKWQTDENGKIYRAQHGFNKRYYIDPAGKNIDDVWDFTLASRSYERVDYATQKPKELLDRIIVASSDKEMIVADFFGGSGVAAKSAYSLGRRFVSVDVGGNAIQTMRDGLVELGASFDILKIKDGIDLFRNPAQTMTKLATIIPSLSTSHDYGDFWFGAITDDGFVCPCWVPNLLDKSQTILNSALFSKILDETAKLEGVSKVVICTVDKIEDTQIDKMIKEYDLRDTDGKSVQFVFKDLKELTDLLVYPDIVEFTVNEKDGNHEIVFDRFVSDALMQNISEFNEKKQVKKGQTLLEKTEEDNELDQEKKASIVISEEGLELIEYVSIDCTNTKGTWVSAHEIKIDKRGYVIVNGKKTKDFWDGKIIVEKKPLRIKVRSIAGDETVVSTS